MANMLLEKDGSMPNRQIVDALQHLFSFYQLMLTDPYETRAAGEAARHFCMIYSSVSEEASNNGTMAWKIKPTFHMFIEIDEFQNNESGDPSRYWAYKTNTL